MTKTWCKIINERQTLIGVKLVNKFTFKRSFLKRTIEVINKVSGYIR